MTTESESRRALRLLRNSVKVADKKWVRTEVFAPKKTKVGFCGKFKMDAGGRGGVRKFNIGAYDEAVAQERVLLLVGGTGSGKTTLLNSMVNYLYEVTFFLLHAFK